MSRKIDVRRILDEKINGLSNNEIARQWRISKHSVGLVVRRGVELGLLPDGPLPEMDGESLYKLFFHDKVDMDEILAPVDFDYVHKELNRTGVTLKLLWKEYKADCVCSGKMPMSYQKFCRRYSAYYSSRGFATTSCTRPGTGSRSTGPVRRCTTDRLQPERASLSTFSSPILSVRDWRMRNRPCRWTKATGCNAM